MDINFDDVYDLKVEELRKILKKKRLSTVGKKSVLQYRLVEFLEQEKIEERDEETGQEPMEAEGVVEEEMQEDELMNETFEVEPNTDEAVEELSDDFDIDAIINSSLITKSARKVRPVVDDDSIQVIEESSSRTPRRSARKTIFPTEQVDVENLNTPVEKQTAMKSSTRSTKRDITTPIGTTPKPFTPARKSSRTPARKGIIPSSTPKPITPGRGQHRAKFEAAHAKLVAKEENIQERQKRIEKRHEELCDNVPDSIKRLATPKSARVPLRGLNRETKLNFQMDTSKSTFQFGEVAVENLRSVQKPYVPTESQSAQPKRANSRIPRADVKSLTRNNVRRRLAPISDPEPVTPITPRTPRDRKGYTPHTGKKVFVDTTGLTDREFELAVEEGLVTGKKSVAKKNPKELRAAELKKRRDDVIALKRKLKL